MKLFIFTLRFLTRIPVPYKEDTLLSDEEFAKGILFYPIIGLIVGLLCALSYLLFFYFGFFYIGVVAAIFTEILLTGAFHLDGLSDTCDGLFSSRKKERMLEIMHDSRVGTNGVVAIVFDILWKVICISSLHHDVVFQSILLMPVAGKMITPVLMHSVYARTEKGLGSIYLREKYTLPMIIATLIGSVFIIGCFRIQGIISVCITFISAILVRSYCNKKIGGMTGDTLGAGCEIAEIIFLISLLFLS